MKKILLIQKSANEYNVCRNLAEFVVFSYEDYKFTIYDAGTVVMEVMHDAKVISSLQVQHGADLVICPDV